jgi:lipid A 3-O-deacylase
MDCGLCRLTSYFFAPQRCKRAISTIISGAVFGLIIIALHPLMAWSQATPETHLKSFSLYWENDSVTGADQDYSNGLKLTWSQPYLGSLRDRRDLTFKDRAFRLLPFLNDPYASKATAFSIGQFIYTPKDTDRSDLIVNDRPYAGYTFIGVGFISNTGSVRHYWEIDLGVVGPLSLAEYTQNGFHDLIGVRHAKGWDHQLGDEPGLEAVYEVKWQYGTGKKGHGLGADLIPHLGFEIGNIAIAAKTGVELRFGWFIPEDFGNCPIRSACEPGLVMSDQPGASAEARRKNFGFHFFTAVEGKAKFRDIFLDGNTFRDSHRVDKEIYVGDLMGGIAVNYGRFKASYAIVVRSPEFKQRKDRHAFGTINISYIY